MATMDFETAVLVIKEADRQESDAQWTKGDAALEVTPTYGEHTLKKLAELSGEDYETLKRYRSVAKAYKKGNRFPNLSFKHHLVLGSRYDRHSWLRKAEAKGWSAREM